MKTAFILLLATTALLPTVIAEESPESSCDHDEVCRSGQAEVVAENETWVIEYNVDGETPTDSYLAFQDGASSDGEADAEMRVDSSPDTPMPRTHCTWLIIRVPDPYFMPGCLIP